MGVYVLGGLCPGDICPWGKCLGGTCPGGYVLEAYFLIRCKIWSEQLKKV